MSNQLGIVKDRKWNLFRKVLSRDTTNTTLFKDKPTTVFLWGSCVKRLNKFPVQLEKKQTFLSYCEITVLLTSNIHQIHPLDKIKWHHDVFALKVDLLGIADTVYRILKGRNMQVIKEDSEWKLVKELESSCEEEKLLLEDQDRV